MAFLTEIAAYLVAQGVGTLGTNLFVSSAAVLPAGVTTLTLRESGGTSPARNHSSTATQRPSAQLMGRGVDYVTTRALVKAAYDALGGANGLHNVTLSGVSYLSITAMQEPTDIGVDEGKASVVFNINAEKQPS